MTQVLPIKSCAGGGDMPRLNYTAAAEALRAGDRLRVTLPNPERIGDTGEFYLEAGGSVTVATFRRLVPNLHPLADGLFPDGPSQTYTWKEAQ